MAKFKEFINEQAIEYKIYVDMDGTLTDFEKEFRKIDGSTTKQIDKSKDREKFWNHVDKGGLKFWSLMEWNTGAKKLWNYIKKYNPTILTSPASLLKNSFDGKKIWVKRELGNVKLIFKKSKEKHHYADSESVLIDDLDKNIKNWIAAGGIGIKFTTVENVIRELKKLGL